jgi:hypothetical protein
MLFLDLIEDLLHLSVQLGGYFSASLELDVRLG